MEELVQLAIDAGTAEAQSGIGDPSVVPFAEEAVKLINENEHENEFFGKFFIEIYNREDVPYQFIALCMYHLKLKSVYEYFTNYHSDRLENNDWRAIPIARAILDAYEEPWEDKETYYYHYEN